MDIGEALSPPAAAAAVVPGEAGPTVPRMVLGMRLRQLREARGVSQGTAGEAIRASRSKVCRLELGRTSCKLRDIADLLELYGVTDEAELAVLLGLAEQANTPGWWQPYGDLLPEGMNAYVGMEQAARVIRGYDVQTVPVLLRTAAYTRAVAARLHPQARPREIERRVELVMRRQRILHRPGPARLWTVLDEAALCRPVGGAEVMRAQLRKLIRMCALPHVTVQILPFSRGAHSGLGGPLTLLRLPGDQLPDAVCLEQHGTVSVQERRPGADRYWDTVNRLAVEAEVPEETPAILHRLLNRL